MTTAETVSKNGLSDFQFGTKTFLLWVIVAAITVSAILTLGTASSYVIAIHSAIVLFLWNRVTKNWSNKNDDQKFGAIAILCLTFLVTPCTFCISWLNNDVRENRMVAINKSYTNVQDCDVSIYDVKGLVRLNVSATVKNRSDFENLRRRTLRMATEIEGDSAHWRVFIQDENRLIDVYEMELVSQERNRS